MTNRISSAAAVAVIIAAVLGPHSRVSAAGSLAQTAQKPTVSYFCPMDPEVRSGSPGKCPKCGMTLRESSNESSAVDSVAKGPPVTDADFIRRPLRIPDTAVIDQNGRKLNFYSDLVKGKTVAINFIFTTCTTICPPLAATFRKVQTEMGGGVELISISVDPVVDVPGRLKSFLAKFNAGPGWTFVTGEKPDIDALLRSLGAYVGDKNDHSPSVVIVNDNTGYWTRAYGLSPAGTLLKIIREAGAPAAKD